MQVPCGTCLECRKRRAASWAFRLLQEEKVCESALFVTLTYDEFHCDRSRNRFMVLSKRDVQLFFKRLRKLHESTRRVSKRMVKFKSVSSKDELCDSVGVRFGGESKPLKYFAVGEYGGVTQRPHYHAIIFNADVKLIESAWICTTNRFKGENPCKLQGAHMLGHVDFGRVEAASVGYCMKYICKNGKIPMHRNDDRIPEFSLMSKGLGLDYMSAEMIAWHKGDLENRVHCNIEDGKKIAMPRYYRDKIYDDLEKVIIGAVNMERLRIEEKRNKDLNPLYYHDRLEAIEAMKRRKQQLLTEKLLL